MLLVRIICGPFILMVVLSDMVLPQRQPAIRLDFSRTVGENQITLRCRWSGNFSNVQDPHLFVNSTNTPVQFERLEDGVLEYNISQELEGYYYCGASPNNIDSNSVTLIAYPQPRSSIPTQRSVEVGQTITVDCPIAVGALRELYTFIWRKGQTLDTTRPGTPYSVDPLNKSLTIVNVQLDNNGTYYCDVVISVPGVNPYFVPDEYTKISLFVTGRQPMPSTTASTLKPSLPDRTDTLITLSTFVKGISTGSPPGGSPSMTPSPTDQQTTMSPMESLDVKIVVLPIIGVLVLLIFGHGCVGCVCILCLRFTNKRQQQASAVHDRDSDTSEASIQAPQGQVPAAALQSVSPSSGEQPTEQPNIGGESMCNQNANTSYMFESKDLKKLVRLPVASNWWAVGIQLDIPKHTLNAIEASQMGDPKGPQRCLAEAFDWWINNADEPSYENLKIALSNTDNGGGVKKLSTLFDPDTTFEPEHLKDLVLLPVASDWRDVGLQLGIPMHTLSSIQASFMRSPRGPQHCLENALAWWLNNAKEPSYNNLKTALLKSENGEGVTKLSELYPGTLDPKVPKLDSGKRTPEYSVFLENYDKLSRTLSRLVTPNDLANRLFANKLIGDDLKEQANNVYVDKAVRIGKLLAAVLNQIDLNCTVYQKFIEILQDYEQLKKLLTSLKIALEVKQAENRRIAADGGSDDEDGTDDGDGDDDDEDYEGAKEAVWMVTSL